MRFRHPLARWIILTSLYSYELPLHPSDALDFLIHPIQQLFAELDALIPTLKKSKILAARYQNEIVNAIDVDWQSPLLAEFSFLDAIHAPEDMAKSNTRAVAILYRHISPADFLDPDSKLLNRIAVYWSGLCNDTAACLDADPELMPNIRRLAEV